MKRESEFENYNYKQQADSLKMTINQILPEVKAHMRRGREQQKKGVEEYPAKIIGQLELIIKKLEKVK